MLSKATLQMLRQIAHGLCSQFGSNCEVVVHDLSLRQPDSSIVIIENGHVSSRKLGDGPSHIVLEALRADPATLEEKLSALMSDLATCSRRGLAGRFDSTIGAGTVVMPYGGARQLTPMQSMIAKLPVMGETKTCSAMAYGFEPRVSEQSPYLGAYLAVVESAARLVAPSTSATRTAASPPSSPSTTTSPACSPSRAASGRSSRPARPSPAPPSPRAYRSTSTTCSTSSSASP